MGSPKLEIALRKIEHNARCVVKACARLGVEVLGVTKSVCGHPAVAAALLRGGVTSLGDSRLENLTRLRRAGISIPLFLLRLPTLDQASQVVEVADTSLNSEVTTVKLLSEAAERSGRKHGVVLMIELGDGREGVMPEDAITTARAIAAMPGISLEGVAANFTCLSGMPPTLDALKTLVEISREIENRLGVRLKVVSGGNSSSLPFVFDGSLPAGINQLRIGESIMLGCFTPGGEYIHGLYQDTFQLIGEVIELKRKPGTGRKRQWRAILNFGSQDVYWQGLRSSSPHVRIVGASSDHMVVEINEPGMVSLGSRLTFHVDYKALVSSMTSPYVIKDTDRPTSIVSRNAERLTFRYSKRGKEVRSAMSRPQLNVALLVADGMEDEARFDTTTSAIRKAIVTLGHQLHLIPVDSHLMESLLGIQPDVVFANYSWSAKRNLQVHVAGLLEMLDLTYTGSDPEAHTLALNKGLAKMAFVQNNVPTPRYQLVSDADEKLQDFEFPVIVKPCSEGSSAGLDESSVVYSRDAASERIARIIRDYGAPALVEEFIKGREFTVGILGNPPRALPVVEIAFSEKSNNPGFYTVGVKLNDQVATLCPARLNKPEERAIQEVAVKAFLALGCRDYGRVDIRVTSDGRPLVLEVNALPGLKPGYSDFPKAAAAAGFSYNQLIERLIFLALERGKTKKTKRPDIA